MTEVQVGDSALVVVTHGFRSYDCYDVKVESMTKGGQITVSYIARGGYAVTKRFYKRKYSGKYEEFGASSDYNRTSVDIYFGAEAEKERAGVLEWRKQQDMSKLAKVIEALNKAERWNNEQAKTENDNA